MIQREAIPKPERTDTIEEFCKRHGISDSTYNYQKAKKENKAKVLEIWLNEAFDGGNEVLKKLKENALEGKEKSIEMYMKFILELAEKMEMKIEDKNTKTYEQALAIIRERERGNKDNLPK
jgi:hypothetical protein